MCTWKVGELPEQFGYVPRDLGIGGGDFVRFSVCLECGTMQHPVGKSPFPLPVSQYEDKQG